MGNNEYGKPHIFQSCSKLVLYKARSVARPGDARGDPFPIYAVFPTKHCMYIPISPPPLPPPPNSPKSRYRIRAFIAQKSPRFVSGFDQKPQYCPKSGELCVYFFSVFGLEIAVNSVITLQFQLGRTRREFSTFVWCPLGQGGCPLCFILGGRAAHSCLSADASKWGACGKGVHSRVMLRYLIWCLEYCSFLSSSSLHTIHHLPYTPLPLFFSSPSASWTRDLHIYTTPLQPVALCGLDTAVDAFSVLLSWFDVQKLVGERESGTQWSWRSAVDTSKLYIHRSWTGPD